MSSSVQMQAEIDVLARKMQEQHKLIQDLSIREAQLKIMVDKELKDVERLENEGFLTALLKLIGQHEGKLSEEQEEYLQAKLTYEKCIYEKEEAMRQVSQLEKKIALYQAESEEYQDQLVIKRRQIEALPSDAPERLVFNRFLEKEKAHRRHCSEIKEAREACETAIDYTSLALADLSSAEGWANWDTFAGGGLFTDLAKYDKIDAAGAKLQQVRAALSHLNRELADINETLTVPDMDIDSGSRGVDMWFDNIFTDFHVRDQIIHQLKSVQLLSTHLYQLKERLELKHEKAVGELKAAIEALENIVME